MARATHPSAELVEETWPVVLPLIGAGILAGIGIVIGLLLLLVPGLILLTIWSVIAPVIVVEHSGVIDAFGRSRALVKGNGWQVFGVILVVFLITAIVSFVLRAIGVGISDILRDARPLQPDRLDRDRADHGACRLGDLLQPSRPAGRPGDGACASQRRSFAPSPA